MRALYICYFGLREPLVQTQVLPYLREIGKGGVELSLLTFEPDLRQKWTPAEIAEKRASLAAEGIKWQCLAYHKRPSAPATAWDTLAGAWRVRRLIAKERFDVLHCRVHLPGLMGALARKFSRHKPKIIFDIRGFFPEEYTDAGRWPENGWLYRAAKRVERWLLRESDAFVVLTEKARDILFPASRDTGLDKQGRPVEVIPCCVDIERFAAADANSRAATRKELGVENRTVIVYAGSFGGWYLTDEMLDLFATAKMRDPNVFAMILTQRDKEKIADALKTRGFADADCLVETVAPHEMPKYLGAADISISFIKACYSKQSSSPTKLAEYLACGLPIIANRGVGDVDELIERNKVGVLLDDFSPASYQKALDGVSNLGDVSDRCRETARREFDLKTVGGERYRRLYHKTLT
ncbi:MAG: glycosyltransferase family 4 protein [Acidobacteria bacterium]|nr:glycosyltransferase family 4 protein [Acidobacteriota bacterium]